MKQIVQTFGRLMWVCLLVAGSASVALAQTVISGTLTDGDNGEPLIGANVLVVGTDVGTATDFDGKFELSVPADATAIRISYAGYSTQVVNLVAGQARYDLSMDAGELLDEVVVIGYGSVKKEDLTGAISAVSERDFQTGIISSPEQLIQGRVAGVQISENSGEPGGGVSVRIRGTASVRGGNDPLYVVDGVPLSGAPTVRGSDAAGVGSTSARNPLAFINPSDIESISILKDASAAAIYGARGANGVVIVTTKSGKGAGSGVQFSSSVGVSTPASQLEMLDRTAFLSAVQAVGGNTAPLADGGIDGGGNVDYQDEIFQTGIAQNYNLSFGGGNETSNYRFSTSYLDQQGIVKNSALERFTGRLSANHSMLDDRVDFGVQLTASRVNDEFAPISNDAGFEGDLLGAALKANPTLPIMDGDEFRQSQDFRNPLALLEYIDDNAQTTRLLANLTGGVNITDALRFQTTFGYDNSVGNRFTSRDRRLFVDQAEASARFDGRMLFPGGNSIGTTNLENTLWENTLSYSTDVGDNPLSLLVGYGYQRFDNRFSSVSNTRSTVPLGQPGYNDINAVESPDPDMPSGVAGILGFSERNVTELQSFFARGSYTINGKYLATATIRRDGSSRFGGNNRYGTFPSFSVGWRLSEEDFIPSAFYDLKLRVGYGITGNQEFPDYQFLSRRNFQETGNSEGTGLPNPDLQWEQTAQFNVGFDYGFLDGRLLGSVDFFNKVTEQLLFFQQQAGPTPGEGRTFKNLPGEIVNSGVELSLDFRAIDNDNFAWQTILTGAYLNNEVRGLDRIEFTGAIRGQGLTGAFAQQVESGQPLFAYYLPTFTGFDSEGRNTFANNGIASYVGDPIPDVNLGWANNFNFGNFDAGFFLQGVFGFDVYNNTANAFFLAGNLATGRNTTVENANSGEAAENPGIPSTRFLEKGDFVRLQNVNIGYNIPLASNSTLRSARVYLTGQNLALFTNYSGYDPEVNTDANIDGIPSLGIDYTAYPRARTILLGLNLGF